MLSASTPSLRLGFSDSDFIFILPRVPPLTRLHPGLPYAALHAQGSKIRLTFVPVFAPIGASPRQAHATPR